MRNHPVIVLPGDILDTSRISTSALSTEKVTIGCGLRVIGDAAIVINPGVLQYRKPSTFSVESSRKKYYPLIGDQVVGIVEDRGGDFYMVNIFCGYSCILNRLAFDGATKRNRPELKRGEAIYARVVSTGGLEGDVEISCTSASAMKRDWSSGETIYGGLAPGLVLQVSSSAAHRLLRPDCAVLFALSRFFSFEIAVGVNGAVWLRNTGSPAELVAIRSALMESAHLDDAQAALLVEQLVQKVV